ncbi:MAG: DUF2510 domain-containing protein [Myxococcota bacterium]
MATGPEPGWYDDGHGKQRWWDGARWSEHFIDLAERDIELHDSVGAPEDSFAGLTVDGRWIHFGALSQPIAGAAASPENGAELLRRGRLSKPAIARALYGPSGLITPRLLPRAVIAATGYILVDVPGQVWLATVPAGQEAHARQFAAWINTSAEHYRYR